MYLFNCKKLKLLEIQMKKTNKNSFEKINSVYHGNKPQVKLLCIAKRKYLNFIFTNVFNNQNNNYIYI